MTQNKDRSKTTPLSAAPEAVRQNLPPRAALLIYHRDGNTVVTLMPGESVVIGRSRPADVVIADPTVSSRHARFTYTGEGGAVRLLDLGSTNGTFVNDVPITEGKSDARGDGGESDGIEVEPGDHIRCGSAVVVLMLLSQGERRPRGLDSEERVTAAFAEELERARHFGRDVSLLLVGARVAGEHAGRFAPEVQDHIRAIDRAAMLSPTTIMVLLSERKAEEARAVAEAIVAACKDVAIGVAAYPELCFGRPDAMLEGAQAALAVARKKGGVALAEKAFARVVADNNNNNAPVIVNPAMKRLFDNVAKFARSTMPVVIKGETGSGKEVVARALHDSGPRKGKPMISVNCGALPPSLLESLLFGTEKGIATNVDARPGLFESANGGTLFLDEIAELSQEAQSALLRVLESKVVTRLGSLQKEIKVDVRVIAATHKDLEEMAADGKFRSDLLFRLEGERFDVPPLRDRPEEILPIAKRFLERASDAVHVEGFDDEATAALLAYEWPGNIRELKNAIERAVVVSAGPLIGVDDLPTRVRVRAVSARSPGRTGLHRLDDVALRREITPLPARAPQAPPPLPSVTPPAPPALVQPKPTEVDVARNTTNDDAIASGSQLEGEGEVEVDAEGGDYKSRMRALEAKVLIEALERNAGVQVAAAKDLKMPVRTFVHKLKALGIKRDKGRYVQSLADADANASMSDEPVDE